MGLLVSFNLLFFSAVQRTHSDQNFEVIFRKCKHVIQQKNFIIQQQNQNANLTTEIISQQILKNYQKKSRGNNEKKNDSDCVKGWEIKRIKLTFIIFEKLDLILSITTVKMIETRQQQTTPSVYFNFDYSNQKTNEADLHKQYVPYEYSFSTNKMCDSNTKDVQFPDQAQCEFATPPSYLRNNICKNLLQANSNTQDRHALISNSRLGQVQSRLQNVTVKLNTQQFFDDFDKNFVVNFGQTPIKNQTVTEFRKTFQSCPGGPTIKDSISSKIDSHISEPLARRNSIEPIDHQNQQQISGSSPQLLNKLSESQKNKQDPHLQKENKPPNEKTKPQTKVNCEIRKRIMLKNNEKISSEIQKRRNISANRIINQENLLVITSSNWDNWTDLPRNKKGPIQANSQPITRADKTLKKVESNIFTTRQMFKQTLRSTTLDSWKKKFTLHKNELDLRHKNRRQNIFQKPFSLIR